MWGAVTLEWWSRFGLALGKLRHIFQPLKITSSASDCSPCNVRILVSWDVVNKHRNVLWSWKLYDFKPLFSLLFYAQWVNSKLRLVLRASDGLQRVLCKGYTSANLLCLDPPVLGLYLWNRGWGMLHIQAHPYWTSLAILQHCGPICHHFYNILHDLSKKFSSLSWIGSKGRYKLQL